MASVIVFLILGGLQFYMSNRPAAEAWSVPEEISAAGVYEVELTLSFDAGPDAFALDLSDATSVLVQFRGNDVIKRTDNVAAGEMVTAPIEEIKTGQNEFFVRVTPADGSQQTSRAIRVRIRKDGSPVADETLWSEPGDQVEGVIVIAVD